MSHFTVLVVTDTPEEVEAVLQPYHEYECTGINDEYVVFVDHHDEMLENWKTETSSAYKAPNGKVYDGYEDIFYREFTKEEKEKVGSTMGSGWCGPAGISYTSKDWNDGRGYRAKVHFVPTGFDKFERPISEEYETIEEYASEYHGYDIVSNGRIGTYTNPNAEWDWYQIGGRWSNYLMLKSGHSADQAIKSDIDFDTKMSKAAENYSKKYDAAQKIINGREFMTWKQVIESIDDIEEARKVYKEQSVIIDLRKTHDNPFFDVDDFSKDRDDYINENSIGSIATFAVLYNGEWKERGDMGWWGAVSDENDDWANSYLDLLKAIPDDKYLTVVDCHI